MLADISKTYRFKVTNKLKTENAYKMYNAEQLKPTCDACMLTGYGDPLKQIA